MTPNSKEYPTSFTTKRLLIRAAQQGDGKTVRTAVLESQNELKQWLPWAVDIPDEAGYEALMQEWQQVFKAGKELPMLMFEKANGALVGAIGMHAIDWDVPKFEIGYWVRTALTGNGYMTEAVEAVTTFAFAQLGAERVEIRCDAENQRSAAIPRRLGFVHEGTLRAESRHHLSNKLRDTMIFAKVRRIDYLQ